MDLKAVLERRRGLVLRKTAIHAEMETAQAETLDCMAWELLTIDKELGTFTGATVVEVKELPVEDHRAGFPFHVWYELSFEVKEYHRLSCEVAALFTRIMALTRFLPSSTVAAIVPEGAASFRIPTFNFPDNEELETFDFRHVNLAETIEREREFYIAAGLSI